MISLSISSVWNAVYPILIAILFFEVIIIIHEGGHFFAAKMNKIKVNEFSIGMGPKVFSKQKGETKFSLRWILFGGYCAMEGEDEESDSNGSFSSKKVWQRITVVVAGAVMNLLLGFVIMIVIVVGTKSVDIDGKSYDPAGDCGIQTGDVIISINSKNVYTAADVELALNDNTGGPYKIKYKRDGQVYDTLLKPVYSNSQGCYKAGMWVRDSTAGIGTITFYNPRNYKFASLGHPINDVDTNEIMPLLDGEAVEAYVNKVYKGTKDETGSLSCEFTNQIIGNLTKNTMCGVYGEYNHTRQMNKDRLYEVASAQEVKKGFAQILTTVEKGEPKLYSIEISKINYNNTKEQKSMVIKVTDEELIQKTGGIVQGMSGSPIIQNGRLVGAVTHVMVNNPKKGYGIFAQNMVEESEK